ncbi:MAG: response regulator [Oligoflexales bacterium]
MVDDSENMRNEMETILKELKCEVEQAEDGMVALEKVTKNKNYDILIVDYHMPNLNGLGFVQEVKKLELDKQPKIFFVTTEIQAELKKKAKELGVNAWIIKPYDKTMITKFLTKAITNIT